MLICKTCKTWTRWTRCYNCGARIHFKTQQLKPRLPKELQQPVQLPAKRGRVSEEQ